MSAKSKRDFYEKKTLEKLRKFFKFVLMRFLVTKSKKEPWKKLLNRN